MKFAIGYFDHLKLSTLTISLGLCYSLPQLFALWKPAQFSDLARKFPRSLPWGYALMGLATLWFLKNMRTNPLSDFENYQKYMLAGFGAVGVLTCIYVKDFLAVRGLAIVLLLLAKLTLDTARWHDSPWRLVLAVWAYLWILAGMWLTISPWRLRGMIGWMTANERRIKIGSAARLAFGLFIIALGLTVF